MIQKAYFLIPDWLIEIGSRLVGYLVRFVAPGSEESAEKRIRGLVWGRRFRGRNCLVGRNVIFVGGDRIRLGNRVSINSGSQFIAGKNGFVHLGSGAHVSRHSVLAGAGGIEIGDFCKISSGVMIYTVTYQREKDVLLRDAPANHQPVILGNDVHVGANATILPGVSIGDNAVIGAGAVVIKDVPANTTVVGSPAKPITRKH